MSSQSNPEHHQLLTFTLSTGLAAVFITILYISPITAAFIPFLLSPTILAYLTWQRLPIESKGEIQNVLRAYTGNGIVGLIVTALVSTISSTIIVLLLFGNDALSLIYEMQRSNTSDLMPFDLERRRQMAWSPTYLVYMVVMCYILAGLLEEGSKYAALRLVFRYKSPKHEMEYVVCAIAAGLGFGTVESIGYPFAAVHAGASFRYLAVILMERTVISVYLQGLLGGLVGIGFVRRHRSGGPSSTLQVLLRPTIFHGTFDLILIGTSAYNGNVGWIHPEDIGSNLFMAVMCFSLLSVATKDFWQSLTALDPLSCLSDTL